MTTKYVHGYSDREALRLSDQADNLALFLHNDTRYPKGATVLEAGCGVGAQTIILAKNSPLANFLSIDISNDSIKKAKQLIEQNNITNVKFMQANVYDLPFEEDNFDHIFVCFVLEHLASPLEALNNLRRVLKKEGTITVIEGDHGSCYFHPETEAALKAWRSLIDAQAYLSGNSLIGREIYPLLRQAGFKNINVTPRIIYTDSSKPELIDGFVKKIIIPMVEGVREEALRLGLIDEETFTKGITDLHETACIDGTFFYNFFKGVGTK